MAEKSVVLAGGCFWGMERLYRSLPGVRDVTAGYANGNNPEYANYQDVCSGLTGFREAVRITYDPAQISLKHLLFAFYAVIDPTMWHRQGMDMGSQYQTGIYWENAEDEAMIRAVSDMEKRAVLSFFVELKPLKNFYAAEEYHQRYLEKTPDGYCHIAPRRMAVIAAYPYTDAVYIRPARELLAAQEA
ncbi:MAG: peptide-methionine (S)-S-oxide reductase MsrA [Clostridiales bacterium]|nr:peptide-methionine (S)-S-oxide reductase MsrA [Candidatus Cacconaster stercorequi]